MQKMASRPNILILMADQLTPGVLAAYGGGPAKTPNIDALAAGGVTFEFSLLQQPALRAVPLRLHVGPAAVGHRRL